MILSPAESKAIYGQRVKERKREMKTPEAIISYPKLWVPDSFGGQEPKYSAALIFLEGTDLTELKQAAIDVAVAKWGADAGAMLSAGTLRSPFRTDTEAKGYPDGATFLNVRSKQRPGVVSQVPDLQNGGKPTVITDEGAIVAGARVFAAISPFAYDNNGNKGVSFGLNHIQLIRPPTQDERLDGRVAAEDTFSADVNAVADLSDLEDNVADAVAAGDQLTDLL